MVDVAPVGDRSEDLPLLQVVAPDGTRTSPAGAELDERLPDLHLTMALTRGLDEELVHLQRQGELALYASCRGQEAAQVGMAAAIRATDWIFPQYRELGAYLVRGIDPTGVGLMWRGVWNGGLGFVERRVAPTAIAIGTNALHAVGAAMASTWLDDGGVTVACFGDGATSEGDVHEALNLAAVQQAPCVFFVQNNGWAISTPAREQYRAPSLAHRAVGYGMPGVRVDGNDVVACHVAVAEAAARARAGDGPTLVEAITYRMGPHTTSDDPTRYRSAEEVEAWAARDPLLRVRRRLEHLGTWTSAVEREVDERVRAARADLRSAIVDAPDLDVREVFDHVLAEPTPALRAQRALLTAELGLEGDR